jgi:hypothetical protein
MVPPWVTTRIFWPARSRNRVFRNVCTRDTTSARLSPPGGRGEEAAERLPVLRQPRERGRRLGLRHVVGEPGIPLPYEQVHPYVGAGPFVLGVAGE